MTALIDPPPSPPADPMDRPSAGDARMLPPRLLQPLQVVAGRARLLAFFRAFFKLFTLVAIVWLVTVLVMGSRVQVPAFIAVPLVAVAWLVVLYGAVRFFRPVFRSHNLASAAHLVDVALPDTQERISSAIELAQEKDAAFRGSPELVDCLIRQAEHHAECMNPAAVVSGKDVFRWFSSATALLLLWFLLLVLMTPNVLLGLKRTFNPLSAATAPQPTLEVSPGNATLAQGQPLEIKLDVHPPQGLSLDSELQEIPRATLIQHFTATSGGAPIPDRITDLERTDRRSFRSVLENVQQPFTYRVVTEGTATISGATSQTYSVAVQTRPGISSLQVSYTYPAYTRLAPRIDPNREGLIDAVVGTKVHLDLETTEPLKTAKLTVDSPAAIGGEGVAPAALYLTADPKNDTHFAIDFPIVKSTQYRVQLLNAAGRDNPDSQPRTITARPDASPTIAITAPTAALRVRPDDTVPLRFTATDDFGIGRIEALIQVDDASPQTLLIPPPQGGWDAGGDQGHPRVESDWDLNVPAVLKLVTLPAGREPRRISYQLRVTDNRDTVFGGGQSATSARQMLELDRGAAPLAQRLDNEAARNLADAVKKASDRLRDADNRLRDIQKTDTGKTLTDKDKQRLAEATQQIAEARQDLKRAAENAGDTRLEDLARDARDIADTPMQRAQEHATKAQLSSDQQADRQQSEAAAQRNIQEAREQLDRLASNLRDAAKNQPLAQSLEQLAQQQRKLADALAQNPNDPRLLQQQKQLQQQLDDLIRKNPQLQKPVADANQSRVEDLDRKLDQIQQAQQPLADPLGDRTTQAVPEQLKDLSRRQQELNRDITQFAQQQADPIRQINTRPPDSKTLDPIVKKLETNNLEQASQDQKANAAALEQMASRLEGAQKRLDDTAAAREKAAAQTRQNVKDSQDIQKQVDDLNKQIQDAAAAKTPVNRPSDPVNQQAAKLADQIRREAQQVAQNPAARSQAQAAASKADAARRSAGQGNAAAAQKDLADAANQLAQAANAADKAAGPNPSPQNSPGRAGEQARALSERQRSLADQAARLEKAQNDAAAARSNPASSAASQDALSERIAEAARDARTLQQQTEGSAPDLSQRSEKAAQNLERAAQAQRDAAQATRDINPQTAALKQSQSADALNTAREALTGKPAPSADAGQKPSDRSPDPQPGKSASRDPSADQQPPSGSARQGGDQKQTPSQDSQTAQSGRQDAQPSPASGQPSDQSGSQASSQGTPSGQNSSSSPGSQGTSSADRSSASGQPGQQASSSSSSSGSSSSGSSSGSSPGSSPGSSSANSTAARGSPGNNASSATPSGTSPGSAAQAVQAARSAQSQAAGGGGVSPSAARQAADQLAQASKDLMSSGATERPGASGSPGAPGASSAGSGASPGTTGAGNAPGTPGSPGSQTGGGGGGIQLTDNGPAGSPEMPREVQSVGLSPSEWARLPPKVQEELLHSAQQPGPAAYRDMIKNYYSKIARMQPDEGAP